MKLDMNFEAGGNRKVDKLSPVSGNCQRSVIRNRGNELIKFDL